MGSRNKPLLTALASAAPLFAGTSPLDMKSILLIALLAAPAAAQSIDPSAYGQLYCSLRIAGVNVDTARRAAIEASWQNDAPASRRQADIRAASDYVTTHCQQYAGN